METRCAQCGAEQPSGEQWEQKVCPACLMKLGLSGAFSAVPIPEPQEPESHPPVREAKSPAASPPRVPSKLKWNWRWTARIAGAAVVLALMMVAVLHFGERTTPQPIIQLTIEVADDRELEDLAVSPDGRVVAYTATTAEGTKTLWARPFDLLEAREISGSTGASMPFWSPDSQFIGFFATGKLKTVRRDGSAPLTIAEARQPTGGTWGLHGILFATGSGLQRVPSTGGEVEQIVAANSSEGRSAPRWPQFLPDGRHFLFTGLNEKSIDTIYLGSLDGAEARALMPRGSGGSFSDGRILFVTDGFLRTQPFDVRRLELTGEPSNVRYAESVGMHHDRGPGYSVAGNVLAYRTGGTSLVQSLVWVDRLGKTIGALGEPFEQEGFALSPEGNAVAVARPVSGSGTSDLWLFDLTRGSMTRITFDARGVRSPRWSPDRSQVAFISGTPSGTAVRAVAMNGSKQQEFLLELPAVAALDGWSPDGRLLLYTVTANGKSALGILDPKGRQKPSLLWREPFDYSQAQFSPDGRWVAYVSNESGSDEVFIREFPSGDNRVLASVGGGTRPAWRRDGRELFYVSPRRQMMAIPVELGRGLIVGSPRELFQIPSGADAFEVAPDGQRFLIAAAPWQERSPITVVLNWNSEK